MSTEKVTPAESSWRAWHLGEGEYKPHGRRNPLVRDQTGAPAKIPADWWERFEEFLSRRGEDKEKPTVAPTYPTATMVSEHFAVREFDCHRGDKVPEAAIPALARLAHMFLEPLRAEYGTVFITSGYRPKDYNASIGGATQSQHIYELTPSAVAADVIPKHGTPAAWGRFLRRIADRHGIGGVGVYPVSGFTHIDNASRRNW